MAEWDALLSSVAHLRKILPEAVLVGGTAAALYAHHRVSFDHDHTLTDLRERFDEVLAQLESVAGWRTARVRRPVLILGSLDGIDVTDTDYYYDIDSDPGRVRAKAYDIVLNGTELGGGSVRIHRAEIQEKMLEVLGFTPERANEQFGFLLEAFRYGVPPHAGLAYGLDRLVMLMTGADSIREVMAFPKVKDASDLMMGAPSVVDIKQLEDLAVKVDYDIIEKNKSK